MIFPFDWRMNFMKSHLLWCKSQGIPLSRVLIHSQIVVTTRDTNTIRITTIHCCGKIGDGWGRNSTSNRAPSAVIPYTSAVTKACNALLLKAVIRGVASIVWPSDHWCVSLLDVKLWGESNWINHRTNWCCKHVEGLVQRACREWCLVQLCCHARPWGLCKMVGESWSPTVLERRRLHQHP